MARVFHILPLAALLAACTTEERGERRLRVELDLELGEDHGQPLGTLFELRVGGTIVAAAGFQQVNGTRLSNNGKVLSFFVANDGPTTITDIGNPFPELLSHTRLFSWRNRLYALSRSPCPASAKRLGVDGLWHDAPELEAAFGDRVRNIEVVGDGLLVFHDHAITFGADTLFCEPDIDHLHGIYRNGHLLVHLFAKGNGPNRVLLASWDPASDTPMTALAWHEDPAPVPASSHAYCATAMGNAFLIGTNFGLYRVDADTLEALFLRAEDAPSWQPYCFLSHYEDVLVGHYPSGRLLLLANGTIGPHEPPIVTPAWAPEQNREAQTLAIYCGSLFSGVWPWGELHELDLSKGSWKEPQRLFTLPVVDPSERIPLHLDAPYVDLFHEARDGEYNNNWGQRITGFTLLGNAMYASTANKGLRPVANEDVSLLGEEVVSQYGRVHRIERPGAIAAQIGWRKTTRITLVCDKDLIMVLQDGDTLMSATTGAGVRYQAGELELLLGEGLYGTSQVPVRLRHMSITRP